MAHTKSKEPIKTRVKRTYDGAKRKVVDYSTAIRRSYNEGYRQGVLDHAKFGEQFGSYVSASYGYYRGLKDSKVARRVSKAKR